MAVSMTAENPLDEMRSFKLAMHKVRADPPWRDSKQKQASSWNPYSFEGGSVAAIAGEDFAVIASDTRMSQQGVNLMFRDGEKIHILNDSIVLTTSGFYGDVLQLKRVLESRLHKYRFDYRTEMTVDLCSEMLSRNLYYKRFFPYYTGAVLAGVDEKGRGAVYSYDPIGCLERLQYTASGSAEPMMVPFFDCQIGHVTMGKDAGEKPPLTLERAISLIKDAFRVSAEREIGTGDKIHLVVAVHGKPIHQEFLPLRED